MSHTCHKHVINITYCNHVTYYDMYTTLTSICLQHCLHYAPYNGAATACCTFGMLEIKTLTPNRFKNQSSDTFEYT